MNFPQDSPRSWRDIARELASEPDQGKRRALMNELNQSSEPRVVTCAICNLVCDLRSCNVDEQGRPVHEQCYTQAVEHKTLNSYS